MSRKNLSSAKPAKWSDADIIAARGPKNRVDNFRPYHSLVEKERSANQDLVDVLTVFLSNKECPLKCLMCDLWKNTTDESVPTGAIPEQIRFAIDSHPPAREIKLYNSGNFFDVKAIPAEDLPKIARQVAEFETVVVENHPKLCDRRCAEFQDRCETQLEVAIGLETSHEETLRSLNKQMTPRDFAAACDLLRGFGIRLRTFVLVGLPETSETECIERAIESVRFAFDCGVDCCSVIGTRTGNGILDKLSAKNQFAEPALAAIETVLNETVAWDRGRVFADLWDLARFSKCRQCFAARLDRLNQMNLSQSVLPAVTCSECESQ